MPGFYADFHIASGVVPVPTFHDPSDRIAFNKLARLLSNRDCIGIYSAEMVLGLDAVHCGHLQEPASVPLDCPITPLHTQMHR